jgi:probable HAF family extracellular repeat protein
LACTAAVNDAGLIVGRSEHIAGDWHTHATLFDHTGGGSNVDLGTLGGDDSGANSINDEGQIVGSSEYIAGDWHTHATLFDSTGAGKNIDLNTLIDPDSGWALEIAYDINNSGWIVGHGINQQGEEHAFLLVPEPATLALLGLGILCLRKRFFGGKE